MKRIKQFTRILGLIFCMAFALCSFGCSGKKGGELSCTLEIECGMILNNIDDLDPDKLEVLPENGVILEKCTVSFSEGESVFDVLVREVRKRNIHMESSYTPVYDSAYVEGINNLYEFDCGEGSGWTYCVNGVFPNYGASAYKLKDGDEIGWHYTCDYGRDTAEAYGKAGFDMLNP